jgi:hypothetical protein
MVHDRVYVRLICSIGGQSIVGMGNFSFREGIRPRIVISLMMIHLRSNSTIACPAISSFRPGSFYLLEEAPVTYKNMHRHEDFLD